MKTKLLLIVLLGGLIYLPDGRIFTENFSHQLSGPPAQVIPGPDGSVTIRDQSYSVPSPKPRETDFFRRNDRTPPPVYQFRQPDALELRYRSLYDTNGGR